MRKSITTCLFLVLVAIAVVLQASMNAWAADFSGADEAAHYVTGLMVRTYVTSMDWLNPVRFAQEYYEAYPKVAIGHWPPMFYLIEAAWTLIFSPSRQSLMLLLATLAAGCGVVAYTLWRDAVGPWLAAGVGAVWLCVPAVQVVYSMVAPEPLLVLFVLLAAWAYTKYLSSERPMYSIAFGCFAVAAIMTKANGLALALVPPIAVLLNRKLYLLRSRSFWWPVPIVVIACLPWYWLTLDMAREGWEGSTSAKFIVQTVAATNARSLYRNVGAAMLVFALFGMWQAVIRPLRQRQAVAPVWATSFAVVAAGMVFHTFIAPVRESRHLIAVMMCLLGFAACGILTVASLIATRWTTIAQWHRQQGRRAGLAGTVAVLSLAQFAWQSMHIYRRPVIGALPVADWLAANAATRSNALVTAPVADGEGAVIAASAMRSPQPKRRIHRASKVFADVRWDGESYRAKIDTPEQVLKTLAELDVRYVVLDRDETARQMPHHARLAHLLQTVPDRFRLLPATSANGRFSIYEVISETP